MSCLTANSFDASIAIALEPIQNNFIPAVAKLIDLFGMPERDLIEIHQSTKSAIGNKLLTGVSLELWSVKRDI